LKITSSETSPGYFVRRLADGDEVEWLRMRQSLWPDETLNDHQAEIEEMRRDPTCQVFVAERAAGGLCGFLEMGQRKYAEGCDTSPVGYIEGWYVDPDMQRKGVGKMLVQAAEDRARQLGLLEMASDCLIDNTTSLAAHLALGYEEVERLITFRKELYPPDHSDG
jgi:aminoglycoside 6'-N-acetyltransferase I